MLHLRIQAPRKLRSLAMLGGLCAALVLTGGSKPAAKVAQTSRVNSGEPVATSESQVGNIEHFGEWIDAARNTFKGVRDYQCNFAKRERIDGSLQEEQLGHMSVRTQPFSVHLKLTAPRSFAGKEASYIQGRHGGKMRAKNGGALGLVGYVTIDTRDARAMQGTRHTITEAGLGNLIDRLQQARESSATAVRNKPEVLVTEYTIGSRASVRFDLTDLGADGVVNDYRTVVYFDKDTNLPVRYESYDRSGDLIECFAYTELHFNIGLTDAAFP